MQLVSATAAELVADAEVLVEVVLIELEVFVDDVVVARLAMVMPDGLPIGPQR